VTFFAVTVCLVARVDFFFVVPLESVELFFVVPASDFLIAEGVVCFLVELLVEAAAVFFGATAFLVAVDAADLEVAIFLAALGYGVGLAEAA
jgi:hypothetical protein